MKKTTGTDRSITSKWRPQTRAVRAGTWRSEQGETSEALFLTSGYAYDDAGTAAARFRGEDPGMTYSRLQNPTVAMLEERIAALEGAEACRVQASGMAAKMATMGDMTMSDHGDCQDCPDQAGKMTAMACGNVCAGPVVAPLPAATQVPAGNGPTPVAAREPFLFGWVWLPDPAPPRTSDIG